MMGNRYVQHNPNAADGPEGFRKFIGFLREKFPNSKSEIKRSFVDGDYVILHVHAVREPGTRGNAIIDIFKLENGKIVEHWDVGAADPGESGEQQQDVLRMRVAARMTGAFAAKTGVTLQSSARDPDHVTRAAASPGGAHRRPR